jgi:hypothetical protein
VKLTIFYSWESDLPNPTNRGFIEGELKAIAKEITGEGAVVIEVDRDTSGIAGSPDIGKTILAKIDAADAFVGDVSIINPDAPAERKTPNPNVMFELGWAFKALGENRVITVMNTAFGGPENLPFDLKQRRTVKYALPKDADKAEARKSLRDQLREAIKAIVDLHEKAVVAAAPPPPDRAAAALDAIRGGRASQDVEAKRFVEVLAGSLDEIDPHAQDGDQTENLLKAIEASRPLVDDFGRVAQLAASEKAKEATHGLVQGMEHILARYEFHGGGTYRDSDFDLFRFAGHELIAVLAAHLVKAERWTLVASLFGERLHRDHFGEPIQPVGVSRLSSHLRLFLPLSKARGVNSVHADVLKARHEATPPVGGIDFNDFLAADLMLFLGTYDPESDFGEWYPRSSPYLESRAPRFLSAATTLAGAKNLAVALNANLDDMKVRVTKGLSFLTKAVRQEGVWLHWSFDPTKIVTS